MSFNRRLEHSSFLADILANSLILIDPLDYAEIRNAIIAISENSVLM
jgi:hypothetical protein